MKPDTVTHYEELLSSGESLYFDPIELDEIYHYYVEQNDLDKVEEVLRLAQSLHPDDFVVKQLDAEYTLNCGDPNEALVKLEEIFTPDHPYHCILRSAVMAKLGRMADALEMANMAMDGALPDDFVPYDLGVGFMNAGEHATAIHYFERSRQQHPNDVKTLCGLLFCKGQPEMLTPPDDLLALAEQTISLDPFVYEAWMAKGTALSMLELYNEAIEAYDYAIAIAPDEPDPLVAKAKCYANQDKADETEPLLKEAISKAYDDQRSTLCCVLAGLLEEQGKHEEAVEACWQSIESTDCNSAILMRAAYTFLELKAQTEALTMMRAAHKEQPDDPAILQPLAELLQNTEHYAEAAQIYERLSQIAPHVSIVALWGSALLSQGNYREALKRFRQANEMEEMWQTYVLMATCDIELKHFHKMEEHFRMAYAMCPDEAEKLMESISPAIVKQMRDNGFLEKLQRERELWIRDNEDRLRLIAEEKKRKKNK